MFKEILSIMVSKQTVFEIRGEIALFPLMMNNSHEKYVTKLKTIPSMRHKQAVKGYSLNVTLTEQNTQIHKPSFDANMKPQLCCSEKTQKTCNGLTGAFSSPLYTHGACNKWCVPPTGWLSLNGQSKVEHGQDND
jgi:hypothetical protein